MRDYFYWKYSSTLSDQEFLDRDPVNAIVKNVGFIDGIRRNDEQILYDLLKLNGIPQNAIHIIPDEKNKVHKYALSDYNGRNYLGSYESAIQTYLTKKAILLLGKNVPKPEIVQTIDFNTVWYGGECFVTFTFNPTLVPGSEQTYTNLTDLFAAIDQSVELNELVDFMSLSKSDVNDGISDVMVDQAQLDPHELAVIDDVFQKRSNS
jgi:hypothetical protein